MGSTHGWLSMRRAFEGLRVGRFVLTLLMSLSLIGASATPTQAAGLRKYAAIVVDAKTGKVIFSRGADAKRYPASVTKVMTLYIVFEELEAGRLKMSSRLKVSKRAAGQQPSKLYLKAGSTIAVRDAIRALITKSANDVASVVAENISGSEWAFAKRMTATAKRLGMKNTTYRNASGLPNRHQITTVRDQARLGAAMLQHFPQHYGLFKTKSFKFRGKTYGNHNRLLGEYGIDGLKTGYTRASGFNLLTSARSKGRHIVIAAFGFKSAAGRNAHVRELARKYRHKGRAGKYRTAALIAKPAVGKSKSGKSPGVGKLSLPIQVVARPGRTKPIAASTIQLASVPKKLPQKADTSRMAQYANLPKVDFPVAPARPLGRQFQIAKAQKLPVAPAQASSQPHNLLAAPQHVASATQLEASTPHNLLNNQHAAVKPAPVPAFDETAQNLAPQGLAAQAQKLFSRPFFGPVSSYQNSNQSSLDPLTTSSVPTGVKSGTLSRWIVQVGAAPSEKGAQSLFARAGSKLGNKVSHYRAYIEATERKGQVFYRARYAGFADRAAAKNLCSHIKSNGMACLVVATH